jgi:polar amino acid transport system substrate-binding protein
LKAKLAVALVVIEALLGRAAAAQDTLAHIRAQGYFTWGADQEGGGPYIYPDANDSSVLTGFEYDLAGLIALDLARQLGRPVEARFAQGQWDMLPGLLSTDRIDVVLNGYEWTPERAQLMSATKPYYIYTLQLLARINDASIDGWRSFSSARPRKLGVLGGSSAERYVRERFKHDELEVVLYDGNTNAMLDVTRGKLDATLQDTPIALFYRKDFPELKFVDATVAPGRYVMFVRPDDQVFRTALNLAIDHLRDDGSLQKVYERYGIWTPEQKDLGSAKDAAAATGAPARGFFVRHGLVLVQAAGMTLTLSLSSMPLAILLGIFIALARLYGPKWARIVLKTYVEVLRGTPLLLQLLFIFYLLPAVGINMHPVAAAIFGLAVNYSAYEAEIYRAGLLAVPEGQMDAALALGMSRATALRRVILPQAVRIVIPPVTNDFIALFKDTSICSVVTVVELAKRYNISVMNNPADIVPLAAMTAMLYLCMSYPLSVLSRRMEAKTTG